MKNFLITAMGRSGTSFLSEVMNRSPQWTVLHEPPISHDKVESFTVQARFNRDFYGEVNGYLRWCFLDVKVAKRGVIIRNPKKILASSCNRRPDTIEAKKIVLHDVIEALQMLDKYIARDDVRLIRFEKMVSDVKYLKRVFDDFDIVDYKLTDADIAKKINKNEKTSDYDILPDEIKNDFMKQSEFFREKYYPDI